MNPLVSTLLALALLAAPVSARAAGPGECLGCHADTVTADRYDVSVHADLTCTACHAKDRDATHLAPTKDGRSCVAAFAPATCDKCHEKEAAQHPTSVHADKRLPIGCASCHSDIHALKSHKGDKRYAAETCAGCHSRQQPYFESIHYQGLVDGKSDAPTCTDCHGAHTVARIDNDAKGREFHTRACLKCHDDAEMMAHNDVTPIAGETYFQSFHGKNVHLGYPEAVAGCADCHTAHDVRAADDPRSSVNPARIVETCRQCHDGASESFARYIPHAEDNDSDAYPGLYWTKVAMTSLLVGTFFFFWLHSALWALRAFVERRARGHEAHAKPAHEKHYRRFTRTQIALHITVVVSFLTLALTGLPLKFADTSWGRALADFFGGPDTARFLHHTAAVVTFGYFAVALVMSFRFLFRDRPTGVGFWQRLFGPDSLFPNRRDLRDMKAMFRWFLFRGPKPTFDRWTYWEKFDFLAVFWGMLAIGLSGLILWFPEAAAHVVPGWAFNVATIIHSDEALLATGFIFTVHFFNTHFRPEKFPMDTVIFDGRISHSEMATERADQLRRYEAEGRLAELVVEGRPRLGWEIGYRIFGFTAVAVGLTLAVAMAWALLT